MKSLRRTLSLALLAYTLGACTSDPEVPGVEADSALADSVAIDSTSPDTAVPESETSVAETSTETAASDTAIVDSAIVDSAIVDTTAVDTSVVDSSATDTKLADTAVVDTAVVDTAILDTKVADTADAAPEASADSGMCNSVVNIGTATPITTMASPTPTGVGGTIVDGIYKLTEFKTYTGSGISGIIFRSTIELSDGGTKAAQVAQNSDKPEFRSNETIVTAGSAVTITKTCNTETPPVLIPYNSFTATTTTLTLYCSVAPYNFSVTYTKP